MDFLAYMATFTRVVEAGSLSRAARAQRVSLAVVSRQIRALEAQLGASLILRTTRQMTITDAGRRFYEHSLRALREVEEARASVGGPDGVLRVSVPVTLGLVRVVPRLPGLLERHPGMAVDLRLEDRVVDLITDGVDVALRAGEAMPDSSALIATPFLSYHRVAVASPEYLLRHGEPSMPAALARHHCLVQTVTAGQLTRWCFLRDGREEAVEVRGPVSCNALQALRDTCVSGLGVAFLADWLVTEDLAQGRLRRVLDGWQSSSVTIWAVYRVDLRSSSRVRAFVDYYRAAIIEIKASCELPAPKATARPRAGKGR